MHSRKFMVNLKENLRISDIILEPFPYAYAIWTTWPRGFAASAAACCCREWKSLSTTGSPRQASRQKRTMIPSGSSQKIDQLPLRLVGWTDSPIEWWKLELLAKCREILLILLVKSSIMFLSYLHCIPIKPWQILYPNKPQRCLDPQILPTKVATETISTHHYDGQVAAALSNCLKI